jgi:uncharacterized protein YbaP (TraB family)
MNKFLIIILSCFHLVACKVQPAVKTSLLWEVNGKKLASPSYLFGTMHLMCSKDLEVSEALNSTFSKTKQLYLELDMDDPSLILASMQGMMMKNGTSLDSLMNKSTYDSIATIFQRQTGIPLSLMKRAKPILTSAAIYPSLLGCEPEGWEKQFVALAKKNKIEVYGLEEAAEQFRIFDSIPYQLQADMFVSMLKNMDSTKKSFDQLLALYKKQDIDELAKLDQDDKMFQEYSGLMLTDRNKNWIKTIEKEMAATPTFIAVGAAHLGGKEGVINLLRNKGYTVKAVKF